MTRRVLLGKAGSDYGLFISKIGVDVVNDSGTLCNNDLMIFDSREKGYAQVIMKGSRSVSRNSSVPVTFSSTPIPNAVVLLYAGGNYIECSITSDFAFTLSVPDTLPDITAGLGYSLSNSSGVTYSRANPPSTTTVNFIVLRGYA